MLAALPKLEEDGGEGNERSEEFAAEFDAGVCGRHRVLGHGGGFVSEDVFPEAGAGDGHLEEAGDDSDHEIPLGEFSEGDHNEADRDDEVEDEPEGRIQGWIVHEGVAVDRGVDVVALDPGKEGEEGSEEEIGDFHLS